MFTVAQTQFFRVFLAKNMSEDSNLSSNEDKEEASAGKRSISSTKIVIPTLENSESDDEENLSSYRKQLSSSEASEGEDVVDDLNLSSSSRPTHLLKVARREARELYKKGDLELAVKERVRCLAYTRLIYGDGHWKLAKAHGKLAEAYLKRKGYYQQALLHATHGRDELLQGEADEYRSNRLSHSNEVLGVMELVYFVMGKANLALGEAKKAEQAFKKAEISSKERLKFLESGQISEMSVKIMGTLAQVYMKLKKFDQAVEYSEKALKQAKRIYGKTDKELIPLYQGLAKAYQVGDGDKRKGVELFEKCHKLAEENYGEGSVELADVLFSTALACQNSDSEYRVNQTQGYFVKCLDIYHERYGADHKKTIKVQEELCRLHLRNGEQDEAAAIILKIIPSKMIVYGDPSTSLADAYQLLGTIRLTQGKTDKALKHLTKSQSMFACVLGSNHKKTTQVTETLELVKKTPAAGRCQSSSEKLRDRPKFNGTVGRSSTLGTNSVMSM